MKRPVAMHCPKAATVGRAVSRHRRFRGAGRHGFTLIEILVATTLSLIMLGAVVKMFGDVGESITQSRSMIEAADQLRAAQTRLQQDLAGVTVTMRPPRKPEDNEGYFEYIEGPVGRGAAPETVARNTTDGATVADSTVGDFDDILMFTTRSTGRPFVGRVHSNATVTSDIAEVAWFVRGRNLHRRVLLVKPSEPFLGITEANPNFAGYYANNDISVHVEGAQLKRNTLGDLTRRECRFAHATGAYPFGVAQWNWTLGPLVMPTLPTLCENSWTSTSEWAVNTLTVPASHGPLEFPQPDFVDFWANSPTRRMADNQLIGIGTYGSRVADDVILTNVIGFDVKAWDPMAQAYVDLGYGNTPYVPGLAAGFSHFGDPRSMLNGSATSARVYDTYSTSYLGAIASNGFDDNADGIVDDDAEKLQTAPYPVPLRGIEVKIRVFDPDSRQIREVTVLQSFLTQ